MFGKKPFGFAPNVSVSDNMISRKEMWSRFRPSKRRLIQLYTALLFNANLKGFASGRIYQGAVKNLCAPGLNCYSCPGASASCPLGALQNALAESQNRVPYYIFGILLLYGLLFGRWICGFLCPFGLIQELLHKIRTPKLKKSPFTRILSHLKYVLLVVFVGILPLFYALRKLPLPAFCKYICPAGTLEGAVLLLANKANTELYSMLGELFNWKFFLLILFLGGSIILYRFFCRFFCPLGAIYGLFNRFSLLGIQLNQSNCIQCNRCLATCQMDIRHVGDRECIHCGDCLSVCPTGAIQRKGTRYRISVSTCENEIKPNQTDHATKQPRLCKIVRAAILIMTLAATLLYYNGIDKTPVMGDTGNRVGESCYSMAIPLYHSEAESFAVANNRGRITVINFWGTWCSPCIQELPHFDRIAKEYAGTVTVLAIHSSYTPENVANYITETFSDYTLLFGQDGGTGDYYSQLGGNGTYPLTLIIDEKGIIRYKHFGSITYEELKSAIEQKR